MARARHVCVCIGALTGWDGGWVVREGLAVRSAIEIRLTDAMTDAAAAGPARRSRARQELARRSSGAMIRMCPVHADGQITCLH